MSNQKTKLKGIPDGLRTMPQLLAYFGVMRACRHVAVLSARDPVVLGLIVPTGQREMYGYVAGLIVNKPRWKYGAEATVVSVDPDPRKRSRAEYEIDEAVRDNERVVVIAEDRAQLPPRFHLLADAIVDAPPIAARDVAAAARMMCGIAVPEADAEFVASLSYNDIGRAFRRGRSLAVSLRLIRESQALEQSKKDSGGPTLDDLHGLGEAGDWGRELAVDLADWCAGKISWQDVERGILLSGPPGTGKTTFASALARTCGSHLVLGSIAKWQSKGHLNDMLRAMYGAFDEAKQMAPAILFVDEIDAIGDREKFTGDNAQYCTEVVNAFLECLDGVEGREGVIVVGACNHPQRIDGAVRRPGRLDRHVVIPLPDAPGREGILRWHLRGALVGEDLSLVVERTEGWSGASLEQLVRQGRRTARRARRDMKLGDLAGELPALVQVPAESLWRSAVHEAGHAVVGLVLGHWDIVSASVSPVVSSAGGSQQAGAVVFSDLAIRQSTADDYKARIARALGGMAAEEAVFGIRTDGGGGVEGSDLYTATIAAAAMEVSLGLGGSLTLLTTLDHERLLHLVQYDHITRSRVEKTLSECYERAKEIARERRGDIERLAQALCDQATLTGAEVREIADAQPRLKLVSPPG